MKIVFVANYLPDTNYTRDLSTSFVSLLKKNDKLFLCGRKKEHILDGKQPIVDEVWEKGLFSFLQIFSYILKKKSEIVHVQHEFKMYGGITTAVLFPWFLLLLRLSGKKVIVTVHAIVSQKQLDKNFLESFGVSDTNFNKLLVSGFLLYVYKLLVLFSDYTTVHASFLKQILIDEYKAEEKKVIVISHGVREIQNLSVPPHPRLFKKFSSLKGKEIILVFGYFSPRKGYEYIVKSFDKLLKNSKRKDLMMVLAGDASNEFVPYKRKIESLIKNKKLTRNVIITGFVTAEEIDELYRISKIAVIPALFSFNTSGALSLSLAYHKVMLVSDTKPISEEIKENKFGLLFELTNPDSFGDEVNGLVSNKKLFNSLQKNLIRNVSLRYWEEIAKEHYKLYKKSL